MPDIASVLKAEISRIARKETRTELAALKKALGAAKADIVTLKRLAESQQRELRRLGKGAPTASPDTKTTRGADPGVQRFSAKGFASLRRRLGLSASELGGLMGVSDQSIYKWEDGRARPRAKVLPAIAHLRTLGKRQVAGILAAQRTAQR